MTSLSFVFFFLTLGLLSGVVAPNRLRNVSQPPLIAPYDELKSEQNETGTYEAFVDHDANYVQKRSDDPDLEVGGQTLRMRATQADHLALLSWEQGVQFDPDDFYMYDADGGSGSTIFVIDAGFRLDHTEFTERPPPSQGGGWIKTWQVPNNITGGTMPLSMRDVGGPRIPCTRMYRDKHNIKATCWKGHGTQVAAVAGGARLGAASRANLYLIKMAGEKPKHEIVYQVDAMEAALKHVVDCVKNDPTTYSKRSVVVSTVCEWPGTL